MPISRKEFESGQPAPSLLVAEFLQSNSDYAYTIEELVAELASKGVNVGVEQTQDVLYSLESQERVDAKTVRGIVYYIYCKPRLGFKV